MTTVVALPTDVTIPVKLALVVTVSAFPVIFPAISSENVFIPAIVCGVVRSTKFCVDDPVPPPATLRVPSVTVEPLWVPVKFGNSKLKVVTPVASPDNFDAVGGRFERTVNEVSNSAMIKNLFFILCSKNYTYCLP